MSERVKSQKPDTTSAPAPRRERDAHASRPQTYTAALLRRSQLRPGLLAAPEVLQLQRAIGNRAVSRHLAAGRTMVQAKMVVTPADDEFEQEADSIAERVLQSSALLRGAGSRRETEGGEEIQENLPVKLLAGRKGLIQEKSGLPGDGGAAAPAVEMRIEQARGGGRHLKGEVREPLERAFGLDFSGVRVHADADADALNRALNARAFTTGRDIFFRQGEYNPDSSQGRRLLAHELTHVAQQNGAQALTHREGSAEAVGSVGASANTYVQLTRAGDELKAYFSRIEQELLERRDLIESPQGLIDLVSEIHGILDIGKAGWSDIAGKIRELMLGYYTAKEGKRVQFGLKEGAGGDVVVWVSPHRAETIQSKYITGTQVDAFLNNLKTAVYQLSGATGEVPYRRSTRVADVVIEDKEYGETVLASPVELATLIKEALDDEAGKYPHINLWTQVEQIRVTVPGHKALVTVKEKDKTLGVKIEEATKMKPEDFPAHLPVKEMNEPKTIYALLSEHLNELATEQKPPVNEPQTSSRSAPTGKKGKEEKEEEGEEKIVIWESANQFSQLIKKDVTTPELAEEIIQLLLFSPMVKDASDTNIDLLRGALRGESGKRSWKEAWGLMAGILGQMAQVKKTGPIELNRRLASLKKAVSDETPQVSVTPVETEERMTKVAEQSKELYQQLRALPKETAWEPEVVIKVFDKLKTLGRLEPRVAAEATRDLLTAPYGLEICSLIADETLEKARARNYAQVLGQFRNREERFTAVGPLKYAGEVWEEQKEFAQREGLILAFEYDEKTPGMWQYTRKHFDMDVGWVYEKYHIAVYSLWQVKVVRVSDPSGILNSMHASLEKGQLSPNVLGGKRLVIFCPKMGKSQIAQDETWETKLVGRSREEDATDVTLELIFKDGILEFDLEELHRRSTSNVGPTVNVGQSSFQTESLSSN